ncbi:hypothetical protein HII28_01285 [Planctomonas sp. JC2975]|uniref:hypothetical protein n=1 Tax=Planctomonas sp. JC2975 TaxID=2729626 RepID=UPI0014762BBE|nr:hypothetical protein [Planctomonas sp. JC2975]NNC10521.1 hypothetical protein [Planctomonas sp. JC2975]
MTDHSQRRPHSVIAIGAWMPSITPRLLVALVGGAASFLLVPEPFTVISAGLALLGTVLPASLAAWGAALVIGLAQLARPADAADWHPYAVLAVVHLLHVLGAMTLVVEPVGRMQVRALGRPLRRWIVIQVPTQAVLAATLVLSSSGGLRSAVLPGVFAVLAVLAVGVAAFLVVRRR